MKKALLAVLVVVLPGVAHGQLISQPSGSSAFGVILATGQSFTATVTGTVTRIDIRSRTTTSSATLRIYDGNNGSGTIGNPGAPVYIQNNVALVDAGGNSSASGFSQIPLSTPFPILIGQQYSFVIQDASVSGEVFSNPYGGGTKLDNFAGVAAVQDIAFQVEQVAAESVPALGDVGLLVLGLALAAVAMLKFRAA